MFKIQYEFTYNSYPNVSVSYEFLSELVASDGINYEFNYLGYDELLGIIHDLQRLGDRTPRYIKIHLNKRLTGYIDIRKYTTEVTNINHYKKPNKFTTEITNIKDYSLQDMKVLFTEMDEYKSIKNRPKVLMNFKKDYTLIQNLNGLILEEKEFGLSNINNTGSINETNTYSTYSNNNAYINDEIKLSTTSNKIKYRLDNLYTYARDKFQFKSNIDDIILQSKIENPNVNVYVSDYDHYKIILDEIDANKIEFGDFYLEREIQTSSKLNLDGYSNKNDYNMVGSNVTEDDEYALERRRPVSIAKFINPITKSEDNYIHIHKEENEFLRIINELSLHLFNDKHYKLSEIKVLLKEVEDYIIDDIPATTVSESIEYILNKNINTDIIENELATLKPTEGITTLESILGRWEIDFNDIIDKHPGNEWNIDLMPLPDNDFDYSNIELLLVDENGVPTVPIFPPEGEWEQTYERSDWTVYDSGFNRINNIVFNNDTYIASYTAPDFGFTKLIKSIDGKVWEELNTPEDAWHYLVYGNNIFVAASWGFDIATGDKYSSIIRSTDGINWEPANINLGDYGLGEIVYENGLFVAIATRFFQTETMALTSVDGLNWDIVSLSDGLRPYGLAYGNGVFVSTHSGTNGGFTRVSTDGINWTTYTNQYTNDWYSIAFGNGVFVASTNSQTTDTIMISNDGINWNGISIPDVKYIEDIAFGDGYFIAVPFDYNDITKKGSLYKSIDGITWEEITIPDFNSFYHSVSYTNDNFFATSYYGNSIIISELVEGELKPPMPGPEVRVHLPNVHYNKYFDIGIIQDPVNVYIVKDMIMACAALRHEYIDSIDSISANDAMNFFLEKVFEEMNNIISILPEEKAEYERMFRMIRWYAESSVIKNSEFWLIRDYSDYLFPVWENDIDKIQFIKENDGFSNINNMVLNPKENAIIEIEFETFITANSRFIFKTLGNEEPESTKIDDDGNPIEKEFLKYKLFIDGIETEYDLNTIIDETIEFEPGIHTIRFESNSCQIRLSTVQLGGTMYKSIQTEYRHKGINPGLKAINDLMSNLVRYYEVHHADKTKRYKEMLKEDF